MNQTATASKEPDIIEPTDILVPISLGIPDAVARRNVTEQQWRTLCQCLFPGARPNSVLMVIDYCQARGLDPLKKPCHIVPMEVRNIATDKYEWRDVVMPGIYEYRTTAHRTGLYLGHSEPQYGPEIEIRGVKAPEWCAMTFYRWNPMATRQIEFPVRVKFTETVALTRDGKVNARWTKAPVQMLTKCTEAAGLRETFPEELGGEHVVEEMEDLAVEQLEDPRELRQPQRKSQAAPVVPVAVEAHPPSAPATVAVASVFVDATMPAIEAETIVEVKAFGEGQGKYWGIKTSRGRAAGTRDAAMAAACITHHAQRTSLDLRIDPHPKPNTLPKLLEIVPLTAEGVA